MEEEEEEEEEVELGWETTGSWEFGFMSEMGRALARVERDRRRRRVLVEAVVVVVCGMLLGDCLSKEWWRK